MSDIQDAIQDALGQLAGFGITKLATYTKVGTPSYDPVTGDVTSPDTDLMNVPVVFTQYRRTEVDNVAVLLQDQKALIATLDLDGTPTKNDRITLTNGSVWNVIDIRTDPADALWVLQIRRP